ncbi:MAG TPA: RcnB family protein, partial [Ramlibacter sp.]
MKTRTILCSIAIASLGFGSLAQAQPARQEARQDAREARQDINEAQRDLRRAPNQRAANEARRDLREARGDLREARQDRREARQYYNARSPEFRRGGRLPQEMRDRQYVVNDWRGHRLAAPPRGHHWVQV